ncbi:MAG: DHHA1 domain-containing protein, partial [Pseudomonadota bacterium]
AQAAVRHLGPLATDNRRVALCLFDAAWHQGVVGLVASRIKDRVGRPVVAFAPAGDGVQLRGSARSIPGIHIRDVFEAIAARDPGLIVRFGGHAMAAGLTLDAARLDEFARQFESQVGQWMQGLAEDAIWTDGQLDEADIELATAQLLRAAGPWGQAFPEPSFDGEFDIESTRVLGDRHVKFWLRPAGSRTRFDAIAFNLLEPEGRSAPPAGRVRLAYRLDVNHFQGESRLQLLVDHVVEAP